MSRRLRDVLLVITVSVLGLGMAAHLSPVWAACLPPSDYSGCQVGQWGEHIAGNLIGSDPNRADVARSNFASIRQQAKTADPDTVTQQLPVTAIFSPDLVRNSTALADVFAAAKEYGIQLTVSLEVTQAEASEVGQKLQAGMQQAGVLNTTNIEILNEANYNGMSGSEYAAILSAFVSGCDACRLYLAALGGPPTDQTHANEAQFTADFARAHPELFDKVVGITFNTYGSTPVLAATEWLNALSAWQSAAAGAGKSVDGKAFFITESGPPNGDPNWQYGDYGTQGFLVDEANEIAKRISTDPRFKNLQGITWFIWEGDGSRMVLIFVDPRTGKATIQYVNVNTGWNLGTSSVRGNPITEGLTSFTEESSQNCPNASVAGDQGGEPTYNFSSQVTPAPEMRGDAGLNFNTAVKGRHCGQAKGDPITLKERASFGLAETPQCKVVTWSGNININNGQGVAVPFAQELANHWVGDWSPEFIPEARMDQTEQLAYGVGADEEAQSKARQEIQSRSGILKMMLPKSKQDSLKCDFIDYVKRKGGNSMYANFTVDGHKLTDVPCPPTVHPPPDIDELALEQQYGEWAGQWQQTWKKLSLFPNERSVGQIRFVVCDDKIYNAYGTYPEVFRLGLAANQLFQIIAPQDMQENFYRRGYGDLRGNPLTAASLLSDAPATDNVVSPLAQNISPTPGLPLTATGPTPTSKNQSLPSLISGVISAIQTTLTTKLLAQETSPGDPLEAGIRILPGDTFNYEVYIRKTQVGWERYPGIIGDVRLGYWGGTPHTEQKLIDQISFDTTNPATASFLPRFNSEAELQAYLATGQLYFRADNIGFSPHLFTTISGLVPPPAQCDPERQCCSQDTKTCVASCTICGQAQWGPSETSGGFKGSNATVGLGSPTVAYNFGVPAWKRPLPLPDGCQQVTYTLPDGIEQIRIECTKEHERVVDVFNNVPLLESVWKQIAAPDDGQTSGVLSAFKPETIVGAAAGRTGSGCQTDEAVVFDDKGNVQPHSAATKVSLQFTQTGGDGVQVSQTSPQSRQILFYRLGGVCNIDRWISSKELWPPGAKPNL